MRIIPEPPETHKLLRPAVRRLADEMWWTIHSIAYGLAASSVAAVLAVAALTLK